MLTKVFGGGFGGFFGNGNSQQRGSSNTVVVVQQGRKTKSRKQKKKLMKNVAFLVDRSGSMSGRPIRECVEGVKAVINTLAPNDYAQVSTFESQYDGIFNNFRGKVRTLDLDDLDAMNYGYCQGMTALYDSMKICIGEFDNVRGRVQKELIVLTDGGDNRSSTSFESLRSTLRNIQSTNPFLHIVLVAVGVSGSTESRYRDLMSVNKFLKYVPVSNASGAIRDIFKTTIIRGIQENSVFMFNQTTDQNGNTKTTMYNSNGRNGRSAFQDVTNGFTGLNLTGSKQQLKITDGSRGRRNQRQRSNTFSARSRSRGRPTGRNEKHEVYLSGFHPGTKGAAIFKWIKRELSNLGENAFIHNKVKNADRNGQTQVVLDSRSAKSELVMSTLRFKGNTIDASSFQELGF